MSYKILSASIAARLQSVLPSIIHESQKGFMKNRYIGECIRTLYDVLVYTERENIPGLLLMIDFEKAFDSVSWSFIEKSLAFFHFPPSIIRWFKIMYGGANSCISFNGQYSGWFGVQRGCRQGDPVSPYFYLICAEILSLMIRNNSNIKGIKLKEFETLIKLFADDTTLYLDGSERSFEEAVRTLDTFAAISGLNINNDKTQVVWIGATRNNKKRYMKDRNYIWDPGTFKVLGITFSRLINNIVDINYQGKINEIKRILSQWNKRQLTPIGKVTVIKTLIASKLTYLLTNLPDPSNQFLKEVDKILYTFLWGGKTSKIKKTTMCSDYEEGGIKMLDIYSTLAAFKIGWVKRMIGDVNNLNLSIHLYPELGLLNKRGNAFPCNIIEKIKNPFWKDVIKHFITLSGLKNSEKSIKRDIIKEEFIHLNADIKRGNNLIYIKEWIENDILRIKDLYNKDHSFLDWNAFQRKYPNIRTNFLLFNGVINAIKNYIKKLTSKTSETNLCTYFIWKSVEGGARKIREQLNKTKPQPTALLKWNLHFPNLTWKTIFLKCYKTSRDTQLQWFQSRLLHRILPTEKYLHICNIKNSPNCTFCKSSVETIEHLFWECRIVSQFWKDLLDLIHDKCYHCTRFHFSPELVLFGVAKDITTDKPMDLIILLAKHHIYKCKLNDIQPNVVTFIRQLKYRMQIENKLAEINYTARDRFEREWTAYNRLYT